MIDIINCIDVVEFDTNVCVIRRIQLVQLVDCGLNAIFIILFENNFGYSQYLKFQLNLFLYFDIFNYYNVTHNEF